jgi:hypothetical protein
MATTNNNYWKIFALLHFLFIIPIQKARNLRAPHYTLYVLANLRV